MVQSFLILDLLWECFQNASIFPLVSFYLVIVCVCLCFRRRCTALAASSFSTLKVSCCCTTWSLLVVEQQWHVKPTRKESLSVLVIFNLDSIQSEGHHLVCKTCFTMCNCASSHWVCDKCWNYTVYPYFILNSTLSEDGHLLACNLICRNKRYDITRNYTCEFNDALRISTRKTWTFALNLF